MKKKGNPNIKNLNNIAKEITRNLEHAISAFSVKHCVGKVNKGEDGESNDSDDEHSLEFLDPRNSADKVFGPTIPAERRLVLRQTIQKMASVMKENKDVKTGILMKWRLARLNERFKLISRQNSALLIINKMFDKRHNAFFKVCEAAKVKTKVTEAIENTISANGSNKKQEYDFLTESMVIETTQFESVNGSSGDKEHHITHHSTQHSTGGLQTQIAELKAKIRSLESELSSKHSESRVLESDLKRRIEESRQENSRLLKSQQSLKTQNHRNI